MKVLHTHTHLSAEALAKANTFIHRSFSDGRPQRLRCRSHFRFSSYLILPLFFILNSYQLPAQCNVDPACLIHDPASYICLEQPVSGFFLLSDFIAPAGPLPQGGGFVNVIIDGDLIADVDYMFDSGAHILLTPGSSITIDDLMPFNNSGPKLAITDQSLVSSCNGYWELIRATDKNAHLEFEDALIEDGGIAGITVNDGAIFSSVNSDYRDFLRFGITIGSLGGDPGQEIGLSLVGNTFSEIQRPVSIFNTQMLSIGRDNTFSTNAQQLPNLVAVFIFNSAVSVAQGNVITGFTSGILHYSNPENGYILNIDGATFKNNLNGIRASGDLITGYPLTEGINAFIKNSTFEGNHTGIEAAIQNGGTCKVQQNTFTNNIINAMSLAGVFPNQVEIADNNINGNGDIIINLPAWNAGDKMKILRNTSDVTQAAVSVTLASGGIIEDNDITTSGPAGIQVVNTSGLRIAYNNVTASGGDGQLSGCIYLQNSPNCKLVCNNTYDGGAGLSFFGYCDRATIARNNMNNHLRGLSLYSFASDGVIGPQTYRDNLFDGGLIAEASMTSLEPLFDIHFEASQFRVEQNTGLLWPSPIEPAQSPSGSADEWFWYVPGPFPELCPEILEEPDDPLSLGIGPFEEGVIEGVVEETELVEGKFRDIDFSIYYKFRKYPSLIAPEYEDYYDAQNTESFQKRYAVTVKMEEMSELSNTLPIEENITTLSNQLGWLALYDDGTQQSQRDSMLTEIKATLAGIESVLASYYSTLETEVEAIIELIQDWEGEEIADDILKEVLEIYFLNFGIGFEGYSPAEKNAILKYAGLCVEEFGRGVYLANAIAGTLHKYGLEEHCLPSSQRIVSSFIDQSSTGIKVFPSPSEGIVNIRASREKIRSVQVFDALGNNILNPALSPGGLQIIDLGQEPAGLYFITILDENGGRQVEKIVLQK